MRLKSIRVIVNDKAGESEISEADSEVENVRPLFPSFCVSRGEEKVVLEAVLGGFEVDRDRLARAALNVNCERDRVDVSDETFEYDSRVGLTPRPLLYVD